MTDEHRSVSEQIEDALLRFSTPAGGVIGGLLGAAFFKASFPSNVPRIYGFIVGGAVGGVIIDLLVWCIFSRVNPKRDRTKKQ